MKGWHCRCARAGSYWYRASVLGTVHTRYFAFANTFHIFEYFRALYLLYTIVESSKSTHVPHFPSEMSPMLWTSSKVSEAHRPCPPLAWVFSMVFGISSLLWPGSQPPLKCAKKSLSVACASFFVPAVWFYQGNTASSHTKTRWCCTPQMLKLGHKEWQVHVWAWLKKQEIKSMVFFGFVAYVFAMVWACLQWLEIEAWLGLAPPPQATDAKTVLHQTPFPIVTGAQCQDSETGAQMPRFGNVRWNAKQYYGVA